MKMEEAIITISDYCHNSNCQKCHYSFDNGRCMFMEVPPDDWTSKEDKIISEDIQHVGYTPESMGYGK